MACPHLILTFKTLPLVIHDLDRFPTGAMVLKEVVRQCTEQPGAPHVRKGGNLWELGPPIDGAWRALNIFHRTAGLPASTDGRWVDGGIGFITSVSTLKDTSSSVNRDPGMCFLPRILACLENKKKNWPTDAIVLNYHTNPETQF